MTILCFISRRSFGSPDGDPRKKRAPAGAPFDGALRSPATIKFEDVLILLDEAFGVSGLSTDTNVHHDRLAAFTISGKHDVSDPWIESIPLSTDAFADSLRSALEGNGPIVTSPSSMATTVACHHR